MDGLEAEFPDTSWLTIYKAVSEARLDAAVWLPDVRAYRVAWRDRARELLRACVDPPPTPAITERAPA